MKTDFIKYALVVLVGALACRASDAKPAPEYRAKQIAFEQIPHLFNDQKKSFLYSGGLAEQILSAMEVSISSDDNPHSISRELVMFSGCRKESCDEKSVAIVDLRVNRTVGVGIRHFSCVDDCEPYATVDYYMFRYSESDRTYTKIPEFLETWGARVGYSKKRLHYCSVALGVAVCN